jgi:hypothetical protein
MQKIQNESDLEDAFYGFFGSVFTEVEAAVFAIHGRHNEEYTSMSFAKVLCCHVKALEYHSSNPL